jgi:hypothetical protein
MNTNNENPSIKDPKCLQQIVRSLDEGPDYQPDWRWRTVEKYLEEINDSPETADSSVKCAQVLGQEKDEIIRQTVEFYCDVLSGDKAAVEYALRTQRTPEVATKIKAMVVADMPIELIASNLGTQPAKIEFFEKLFFDVRRYLDKRDWLETVCYGIGGHRYLQVAFERGRPGVEEIVLHRLPKGPRGFSHILSTYLGRAQAHGFKQEASNTPVSEKDVQVLLSVSHASKGGQLPSLDDPVEAPPLPDTEGFKAYANLSPAARERVAIALSTVVGKIALKATALDAAEGNGSEPPPTSPENEQPLEPK